DAKRNSVPLQLASPAVTYAVGTARRLAATTQPPSARVTITRASFAPATSSVGDRAPRDSWVEERALRARLRDRSPSWQRAWTAVMPTPVWFEREGVCPVGATTTTGRSARVPLRR